MRRVLLAIALLLAAVPAVSARAVEDPPMAPATARQIGTKAETIGGTAVTREYGYLQVRDGIELSYTVVRPTTGPPRPLLLTYDGYDAGANPDASYVARWIPRGYAFMGLSLRGTGCSGGVFDFFQPAEAWDGYQAIEWAAAQPWSNGRVGMVGKSYPGITQLFVAETQPPHLTAIAPGHYFADAYRDVAYPGGIFNWGFASLWSFVAQPAPGADDPFTGPFAGDQTCVRNQRHHADNLRTNPFVQAPQHPFDDALLAERSPVTNVDKIKVPVYSALAWQDEQLSSRQSHLLARFEEAGITHRAVLSNGDHGMYRRNPQMAELDRFFEAHLEQRPVLRDGTPLAHYLAEPPVSIFWEQGSGGPRWRQRLGSWKDVASPWRLPLAGMEATADTYVHNAARTQTMADSTSYSPVPMWSTYTPPKGASLAYTTPPMTEDVTLLGSASADLWIQATAPNVDLQVTLTEVRSDGQEQLVQQGWLRTSHRKLDPARSTELRPVQTHLEADVANLPLNEPALARVEIFPFGQVVRTGSRLRLWVEAPIATPQLWGFALDPTPAAVTVLRDAAHPSSLVLPRAAAQPVPSGLAACGSAIRQACRPDPLK